MRNPRQRAGSFCPSLLACIFCFLIFNAFLSPARAQQGSTSFFETRAVWLATVLGDGNWPETGAPASMQAEALRDIIRTAHGLGINTFYMQVVARGDAMYPSSLLPWSARLAGPGVDPGFDPLQVAVEEAHSLGMELHAWINVFRIGDTATIDSFADVTNPQHIAYAQPGWVGEVGSQVWLDPSADGVSEWLVEVVEEVVSNYDVDGVQFDFIRYPEGGLENDEANFQFDDRGYNNLADWRRGNVNTFVEKAGSAVFDIKPWVKMGATPLGNYRETSAWPALWAYSDVYQESRLWLQNGWLDYLAPQIYFSTGTAPEGSNTWPSPDFTVLVNEWVDESAGRPIVAGFAAYKPTEGRFPASDLSIQIDHTRDAGAAGHAAFRYDHLLEQADFITSRYSNPALPAGMLHRFEARAPDVPSGLMLATGIESIELSWTAASASSDDPLRSYVILRRENAPPEENEASDILAVVDAGTTSYTDLTADPSTLYYYSVASRSALGVVSDYSESISSQAATAIADNSRDIRKTTIVSVFPNPATRSATLTYYISSPTFVEIRLHDTIGRQSTQLINSHGQPGLYQREINTSTLATGVYHVVLRTEEGLSSWPFVVKR